MIFGDFEFDTKLNPILALKKDLKMNFALNSEMAENPRWRNPPYFQCLQHFEVRKL
jgi:hypothetical protein